MMDSSLEIWGQAIPTSTLTKSESVYLSQYAGRIEPIQVTEMWQEINRVWDTFSLDNCKQLSSQPIGEFYSHPVWILNGLFSGVDTESLKHRRLIAEFAKSINAHRIADFGGGVGQLGLCIASRNHEAEVEIIEPFPSLFGRFRISESGNIAFVAELSGEYDLLVCQDVLEHTEHPVDLAERIAIAAKDGGFVIFANCFYPVIKCHLPRTFYLRHTFSWIMEAAGLSYVGSTEGASHIMIFKKDGVDIPAKVRIRNTIAKILGTMRNIIG